jgi:hypothetical protein
MGVGRRLAGQRDLKDKRLFQFGLDGMWRGRIATRQSGRWQTHTDRRHVRDEPIAADQPVSSAVAILDSVFDHFRRNTAGGFTATGTNAC